MQTLHTPLAILLTNDDGIHAPGLWALYRCLEARRHTVVVVAPDRERSAVGHGITLHQPLRAAKVVVNGGYEGWAVTGTPADCVKLAMAELLTHRPDLVISGINPGANVGVNMNYSGTVAAAKEAALCGLDAMAVSIQRAVDPLYGEAASFAAHLAPLVRTKGLPDGTFLNVNIPNKPLSQTAGVRLGRQGSSVFKDHFEKRHDPRHRTYYWQGVESDYTYEGSEDGALLDENYISITPVRCDMTDYDALEQLHTWDLENGFKQTIT